MLNILWLYNLAVKEHEIILSDNIVKSESWKDLFADMIDYSQTSPKDNPIISLNDNQISSMDSDEAPLLELLRKMSDKILQSEIQHVEFDFASHLQIPLPELGDDLVFPKSTFANGSTFYDSIKQICHFSLALLFCWMKKMFFFLPSSPFQNHLFRCLQGGLNFQASTIFLFLDRKQKYPHLQIQSCH